jgi:hypothetical protein
MINPPHRRYQPELQLPLLTSQLYSSAPEVNNCRITVRGKWEKRTGRKEGNTDF